MSENRNTADTGEEMKEEAKEGQVVENDAEVSNIYHNSRKSKPRTKKNVGSVI